MLFSLFLIIAVAMRPFLSMKMHLNRKYVPIRNDLHLNDVNNIRVMQYNILADGLSGLRSDHGGFSRIKKQFLEWNYRKSLFFSEIVECNPDVITLQECDHFVDFFEPELKKLGYQGVFAPKPASACLEVSSRSDGCAVFVKTSKIKIVSTEVLNYALPQHLTWDEAVKGTEYRDEALSKQLYRERQGLWKFLRMQNQVAIICSCEALIHERASIIRAIPLIVATTHLKAAKTARGERLRYWEAQQLLSALERTQKKILTECSTSSSTSDRERGNRKKYTSSNNMLDSIPIVLTGDLNACPGTMSPQYGFNSTVYPLIKRHPFQFRSVMNDDLEETLGSVANNKEKGKRGNALGATLNGNTTAEAVGEGIEVENKSCLLNDGYSSKSTWTTWKARSKLGKEVVVRHCIDYILYSSGHAEAEVRGDSSIFSRSTGGGWVLQAVGALGVPDDAEISDDLLPNQKFPSDHIPLIADIQIVNRSLL